MFWKPKCQRVNQNEAAAVGNLGDSMDSMSDEVIIFHWKNQWIRYIVKITMKIGTWTLFPYHLR